MGEKDHLAMRERKPSKRTERRNSAVMISTAPSSSTWLRVNSTLHVAITEHLEKECGGPGIRDIYHISYQRRISSVTCDIFPDKKNNICVYNV